MGSRWLPGGGGPKLRSEGLVGGQGYEAQPGPRCSTLTSLGFETTSCVLVPPKLTLGGLAESWAWELLIQVSSLARYFPAG